MGDDLAGGKVDDGDFRTSWAIEMHREPVAVERHGADGGAGGHRQIDAQAPCPGTACAAVTLASCAGREA